LSNKLIFEKNIYKSATLRYPKKYSKKRVDIPKKEGHTSTKVLSLKIQKYVQRRE